MKKFLICLLCAYVCLSCLNLQTYAVSYPDSAPYKTYIYNSRFEPIVIPSVFEVERVIAGIDITKTDFNELSDVFYDGIDRVYLCDTKNNRIVVTDKEFNAVSEITEFKLGGKREVLNEPQGVYSDGKTIYISDTGNNRIIVFDADNTAETKRIIDAPEIPLQDTEVAFEPTRLTADNSGGIYVISKGINQGIVWLDGAGKFIGFVGAPRVEFSLTDMLWRNFATKEQKMRMQSFVPTEYDAVERDKNGFLYVTSQTSSSMPVAKLNSNGENIRKNGGFFADEKYITDKAYAPHFSDIALGDVDSCFHYTVDSDQSRIYCYNEDGEMLYAFGKQGVQKGSFSNISAIEFIKDTKYGRHRLVAADRSNGTITVFRETDFGSGIRKAIQAYGEGRYEDAAAFWTEVRLTASGYVPAVTNFAKIELQNGKYKEAMEHLLSVREHELYLEAFAKWRSDFIRNNFIWIIAAVCILAALLTVCVRLVKRSSAVKKLQSRETVSGYRYGSYVMFHPFDGFWDLKREKRGNIKSASIIAAVFFLMYATRLQFSGYNTTGTAMSEVNVLYGLALIFLPLCFWIIANWCITTLMDGKGTLKDIYISTCYALKPYVILSVPMLAVSHFITADELVFYKFVDTVIVIWVLALLFFGLMMTHDYSLSKSLLAVLLILIGICIIIFILLLLIHIITEVYLFAYNSYTEIALRSYSGF